MVNAFWNALLKSRPAQGGGIAMVLPVDTLLQTAEGRGLLRAQHTCIRQASSMQCIACNQGVPYPAATVDELIDGMANTRSAGSEPRHAPAHRPCPKCGYDATAEVVGRHVFLVKRDPPSLNRRLTNTLKGGHLYRREKETWMMEIRAIRLATKIPYAYRAKDDRNSWPVHEGKRRVTIERIYAGRQKERDLDNLVGGMKPVIDALVAERLLVDDSPEHAEIHYKQRHAKPKKAGLFGTLLPERGRPIDFTEPTVGLWFEIEILGG